MSDILSIQNKEGKVRAKPSFLGKIILKLPYGTKVVKIEEKIPWVKVKYSDKTGWLHLDAITEKEIIVNAGKTDVKKAASDDELVLAGKGFSENVEQEYRKKNPKVTFGQVDRMEHFNIPVAKMATFIKDGGLNG
jgi:uncharacterized protein YgiM (DUF1202 family)